MNKDHQATDIFLDEDNEDTLKTYHCGGCGFILFQYYGRVKVVVASTPISHRDWNTLEVQKIVGTFQKTPLIVQCHNKTCGMRYNVR